MANIIGCGVLKFPFKYLGVPVGCNMKRCVYWNAVIQKFESKLSSWKARLLSAGGRLSLIKAVLGNLPTYFMSLYMMPTSICSKLESLRNKFFRGAGHNESKMSWVKWEKSLASIKKGGLGIGSYFGLNTGFFSNGFGAFVIGLLICGLRLLVSSMAMTVVLPVVVVVGENILIEVSLFPQSIALKIRESTCSLYVLASWVMVCSSVFGRTSGLGLLLLEANFLFSRILRRTHRGGAELSQFEALTALIGSVQLSDSYDSWQWHPNYTVGYTVASARALVDESILETDLVATR
nr:RNA-directed DNA polymerase, eukaryota, reverse transcriptase zinc-binding domain protein [Tanacetum cinerariifolium]